jgi:hypothetical protein
MKFSISRRVILARVRLPVIGHDFSRPTTENLTLLLSEGAWFSQTKKERANDKPQKLQTVDPETRKKKEELKEGEA